MSEEIKKQSRSEREAHIKDRAGWAITVIAALLAINTYFANSNSSKILTNTIQANDTWSFYQAKSIKQTAYELAAAQAEDLGNKRNAEKYRSKAESYESNPITGEGKKELMAKAIKLEEGRADAKQRSPWYTFAGSALQISIVLLSAAILSVSMGLFWSSVCVGVFGAILLGNAYWMFTTLL
jgi:hypothetical protein